MRQIELTEVPTALQDILAIALNGEDVLILQEHKPVLKLMRIDMTKPRRKRGSAKGLIKMADDFDAPLNDFSAYMN